MNRFMIVLLGLVLLSSGCGHNMALQSKGWGADFSWNPDSMVPNLRLGYWDVTSVAVRENTEVKAKSNADISSGESSTTPGIGGEVGNSIEIKTGNQINGYTVDAIESDAEAVKSIYKGE